MFSCIRRWLVVYIAVFMLIGNAAAHPKISPDLERLINASGTSSQASSVDVIVQYRPGGLLRTVIGSVTNLVRQLPLVGAVVFRILPLQALSIASEPDVEYISLDRGVQSRLDLAGPAINANLAASAGVSGRGITVAVIDSGINNHADMQGLLGILPRIIYKES